MSNERSDLLIIVWLDAFRADYLNADKTPYLYHLSLHGHTSSYKPTLSFVGIGASMFTGVDASIHGCWTEFYFDPEASPFRWTKILAPFFKFADFFYSKNEKIGEYPIIFANLIIYKISNLLHRTSYRPIALRVPLSVLHFLGLCVSETNASSKGAFSVPTFFDILRENNMPFSVLEESTMRENAVIKKALGIDGNSRLMFLQIATLDRLGHRYGPDSPEVNKALVAVDSWVRAIVKAHEKNHCLAVLIVGDHGMAKVNKTVDVLDAMVKSGQKFGKDYVVCLDSTMARFWLLNPDCRNHVIEALSTLENGKILTYTDRRKYGVPPGKKYGDIIWLADVGTVIVPNYYQGRQIPKGMHGYAPESEEISSKLIISKKSLTKSGGVLSAGPTDVFATILDLVNLPSPDYVKGRSVLNPHS
jgi:hypothetical protein